MTDKRLREIWRSMKKRCENPNCKDYKHYGAHGLRVCKEWQDFDTFKEWALAHGYDDTKTLDRMNNNVGYSPTNCRWISRRRQAYNRTTNRFITIDGQTRTLKEWSVRYGIGDDVILHRIESGWSVEDAIKVPKGSRRPKNRE